jgi:hypothetical protein
VAQCAFVIIVGAGCTFLSRVLPDGWDDLDGVKGSVDVLDGNVGEER